MRTTILLTRKCDGLKVLRCLATVAFVGWLGTGGSVRSLQAKKTLSHRALALNANDKSAGAAKEALR